MTRIDENQFKRDFKSGIDITEETKATLEAAGVNVSEVDTNKDGRIEKKELEKLFKVIDRFDHDGSRKTIDTEMVGGGAPSPSGVLYEALKSEFDRNRDNARLNPHSANVKSVNDAGTLKHANIAKWHGGLLFDFGRQVTKEQATQWIFKDGKVPPDVNLVKGPGNTWHVQLPRGLEEQIEVGKKMKHDIFPKGVIEANTKEITWVDGPTDPPAVSKRLDLNNEYGFKISKNYELDAGQYWNPSHGYELKFDKPMTKEQVMNTLFDKSKKPEKDDVKLIPDGKEPTQTWQVHLMKPGIFKLKPGMNSVFGDANVYAKESIRPDIPASIRTHFENQTIPSNAVAHPKGKPHPPGVYVWEQDGYLAYVITDGKGKNGYYHPQVLKLNDDKNSVFNKDMRYYMIENGMSPDMAVAAHTKQWDELYRMILTGFALTMATAGPVPRDSEAALELFGKNLTFHGVEKLKEEGQEAASHAK